MKQKQNKATGSAKLKIWVLSILVLLPTQLSVTRHCSVHKNWLPRAVQRKKTLLTKTCCPNQETMVLDFPYYLFPTHEGLKAVVRRS